MLSVISRDSVDEAVVPDIHHECSSEFVSGWNSEPCEMMPYYFGATRCRQKFPDSSTPQSGALRLHEETKPS